MNALALVAGQFCIQGVDYVCFVIRGTWNFSIYQGDESSALIEDEFCKFGRLLICHIFIQLLKFRQ